MEQKNKKAGFWYLFGPLVLYWVVGFVAELVVEIVILGARMFTQIDYEAMMKMSESEMTTYLNDLVVKMYGVLSEHIVAITTVVALASIPLSLFFFLRDRKNEKLEASFTNVKEPVWKYAAVLVLGIAMCIGLNNLLNMCDVVFFDNSYAETGSGLYNAGFLTQIICLGIISPISEEMIYRGVLFRRYRENSPFGRAAVYSSILFAMSHSVSIQMLYALILGLFLAYVYEKFGSVKAPVLLHVAANITALVGTKINLFNWMLENPLRMGLITVICAFLASSMFVFIQHLEIKWPTAEKKILSDN